MDGLAHFDLSQPFPIASLLVKASNNSTSGLFALHTFSSRRHITSYLTHIYFSLPPFGILVFLLSIHLCRLLVHITKANPTSLVGQNPSTSSSISNSSGLQKPVIMHNIILILRGIQALLAVVTLGLIAYCMYLLNYFSRSTITIHTQY